MYDGHPCEGAAGRYRLLALQFEFGWENTQKNRDAIYSFKNSNAADISFKLDANEVRRRRRAVYAEGTKGIDYAGICEMLYECVAKRLHTEQKGLLDDSPDIFDTGAVPFYGHQTVRWSVKAISGR